MPHTWTESLSPTAGGHFVLNFYAAVFDLLQYVQMLSVLSGEGFDSVLARHPFLRGYISEIQFTLACDDPWSAERAEWDEARVAFEARCPSRLPFRALAEEAGLSGAAQRLVMLLGLVEEDSRFSDLFAWLQPSCGSRRLTLELAERIVEGAEGGRPLQGEAVWRVLARTGLAAPVDCGLPRTEWTLRTPPELWCVLRGEANCPPPVGRLWSGGVPARPDELIFPPAVRARLVRAARLLAEGQARRLALRADPGADLEGIAAALLGPAGRTPLFIEDPPDGAAARLLGPWCTMTGATPVVMLDLGPGETAPPLGFPGYSGPLIVTLGTEGGLASNGEDAALTIDLPPLGLDLRRAAWARVLGARMSPELEPVLEGFRMSEGFIRRVGKATVAEAMLDGRDSVAGADVVAAARALNHELLDGLADRLDTSAGWDRLVAAPTTLSMLREVERFARGREKLAGALGQGFGATDPQGVRALFTGVSGTGKTMAARLLAGAIGKDLYRVDLAAVVNKYIGETEKNLNRVLTRAEALDVVLLLDEGDALLGARTEVKSANDRYANLETNYLLQRLETYRGIVIVTTNYGENIDKAFQRRMDVVVPFFPPGSAERRAILELHLPPDHAVGGEMLAEASARCDLTGGQLRNVALRAALAAAELGRKVDAAQLARALAIEYEKAGAVFPLGLPGPVARRSPETALDTFLGALRASR
jgi:hypothetical protein